MLITCVKWTDYDEFKMAELRKVNRCLCWLARVWETNHPFLWKWLPVKCSHQVCRTESERLVLSSGTLHVSNSLWHYDGVKERQAGGQELLSQAQNPGGSSSWVMSAWVGFNFLKLEHSEVASSVLLKDAQPKDNLNSWPLLIYWLGKCETYSSTISFFTRCLLVKCSFNCRDH